MTVTATNLIQGPATIYAGAFGATEPADIDTAPGVGWTDLGRKRTGRSINVATSLAEPTLENLARAMNNTAPTSDVVELDNDESAFSPDYGAVLLDGLAPGGLRRRIILRKTLQTGNIAMAYTKDGQTVIPVTFALHWVSASIKALKIEDETEA